MSSDIVISVKNVSKAYQVFDRPLNRLKQILFGDKNKHYDEFWALKEIDFEVKKGETVGIIGRNGSGKSTLLQIICGTVTPTSGSIERRGRISALLELGSGFNPEFTGRENVYLNGAILGLSKEEVDERFDRIAAFADIGHFIDNPVKHYSSGMFARLAFSVAIHVDPEILIVDEILAVGDAAFQRRCLNKFYEIRESGCSILFVSHDQYQIKSVCQRALYLDKGKQKLFGQAGKIIDQYMIDMEKESRLPLQSSPEQSSALLTQAVPSEGSSEVKENGSPEAGAKQPSAPDSLYRIESVQLLNEKKQPADQIRSGETLYLGIKFRATVPNIDEKISFVFNLYKHDGFYICGSTTVMDGIEPQNADSGEVMIKFPDFPLLSGLYKWRVAINDARGFVVHAEAKDVCEFRVVDDFNAVGLISIEREWQYLNMEVKK